MLVVLGSALTMGSVYADDHHVQAVTSGGLTFNEELGVALNRQGHIIPDSPGQGSPFSGNHLCTPATDTSAAQENANVMAKGTDDVADCAESDE